MLWKTPAKTWDASKGEYFYMRAALITMVQDYLGYGYLAGQVCHGYCGCTRCMDDTTSLQLSKDGGSSKIAYMGHRRWLEKDDTWRKHEIYSMVRLSIEVLHVSVAVQKYMSY